MKALCYILFVLLCPYISAQTKTNFILQLDKNLTIEPQWAYLTGYDRRISGNEFVIFDSVAVDKGQARAELSTDYPYAGRHILFFSKTGPIALNVWADPGEVIEMDLNEDTPAATSIVKVKKGKLNNQIFDFREQVVHPIWNKIDVLNENKNKTDLNYNPTDSINFYTQSLTDKLIDEIKKTPKGAIAFSNWSILASYRRVIGEKRFLETSQIIRERFPNEPLTGGLMQRGKIPQSNKSKQYSARMKELRKIRNTIIPKDTAINAVLTITLPTADGKMISTDSIQSEYILVDIWASWCAPCRKETPYIKAAAEKFKDQLSIYAVSLDNNREKWQKAITEDSTGHFTQVIAIKKSGMTDNQIKALGINAIPRNFLLDKQHRIIAKDLRGEELLKILDKLINKE